jgi:hypothetical protein
MENIKNKAENLTDHISDYADTYFKLTVLNATDKAAGVASVSATAIIVTVLSVFFLFFTGIGLGYWLGEKLDNMLVGFLIVAGFYALLAVLIVVLQKSVLLPFFRNLIIRMAYE